MDTTGQLVYFGGWRAEMGDEPCTDLSLEHKHLHISPIHQALSIYVMKSYPFKEALDGVKA